MASEKTDDSRSSPQIRALRQCSAELVVALSAANPLISWQLLAKDLIGQEIVAYCQLEVTQFKKSSQIVCAVIETVSASPHLFESLVSVLSESGNTALMSVGEELQQNYESELLTETHHLPISQLQQSSAICCYANYLRAVYKRSELPEYSNPACYKWIPFPGKKFKFINLAVISKNELTEKEADTIKKKTIYGHIDLILKKKAPITMENILQVEQGQSLTCVLIEGAPGIGKSMLSWEICRRWGRGELFQEYSVVLLVTLRDERVHKATCVEDLFHHRDRNLQAEVVQEIDRTYGKGVLILLEGLDELPRHLLTRYSIFTNFLSGEIFPEATILVTSRPSATDNLWQRWWQPKSRHIQILGFTDTNIDEYSKSVLSDYQLLGFNNYLSIHPHIKSMMYVPLHCVIGTAVYLQCQQSDRPPPKTLTGLYTCLAQTILMQYLEDHPDYKNKEFKSFSDLPSPVYTNFKRLCSLAFDGVDKQQLIFRNLHQSPDSAQQFDHFGFMDAVPEGIPLFQKSSNYSYNFLHLSVQEYLAAYHVSLMSHDKQKQLLQTVRPGDHRFNMIRFLAGITQLKHLDKEVVKEAIGIKRKTETEAEAEISVYALEILYECQDVSILDSEYSYHITIQYTDSVHCLTALGYCIAKSSSKWHVTFSGRNTSGTEVLWHSLKENPHATSSIEHLECIACTSDFTHQVLQHLLTCRVKKLTLGRKTGGVVDVKIILAYNSIKTFECCNDYSSESIHQALQHLPDYKQIEKVTIQYYTNTQPLPPCLPELISRMERLNTLTLENVLDTSLTELIPVLSKVPTLRNLTLYKLNSEGITLLCQWLPVCQLETLTLHEQTKALQPHKITVNFGSNSIECLNSTTEFIDKVLKDIPQQIIACVKTLVIHNEKMYNIMCTLPPLPPCLPELIPRMEKRLNTLTLENVLDTSLTELIPALSRVPTLRNLTLHKLNSKGITLLCQWLPTCQLQTLKLPSLSYDHIKIVLRAFTKVSSPKTLHIEQSKFTFQTMLAFAFMLQQNSSLTDVSITDCCIDSGSACCLAEALHHNATLRKLNMSKNPVGERAVLAMAKMLKHNTTLEELDLSHAEIRIDGAVAMAEALHHNTALRKLNMRGNPVGERGALVMAKMLNHNTTLEELDLSFAKISIDGAVAMAKALYQNTTLRKLDMTLNPVGEQGILAMAEMLKYNTTLEELYLSALTAYQDSISNSSIKALVESLAVNQHLKKLIISDKYEGFVVRSLPSFSALKERVVFKHNIFCVV